MAPLAHCATLERVCLRPYLRHALECAPQKTFEASTGLLSGCAWVTQS